MLVVPVVKPMIQQHQLLQQELIAIISHSVFIITTTQAYAAGSGDAIDTSTATATATATVTGVMMQSYLTVHLLQLKQMLVVLI
jgi:hypothetical protein